MYEDPSTSRPTICWSVNLVKLNPSCLLALCLKSEVCFLQAETWMTMEGFVNV